MSFTFLLGLIHIPLNLGGRAQECCNSLTKRYKGNIAMIVIDSPAFSHTCSVAESQPFQNFLFVFSRELWDINNGSV